MNTAIVNHPATSACRAAAWALGYWLAAVLAMAHGSGEARLAQLSVRLEARPELTDSRLERAALYLARADYDRALHDLGIAARLSPARAADARLLEARIWEACGHLTAADAALAACLTLRPRAWQPLETHARILERLGRPAEAAARLDSLFAAIPLPSPHLLAARLRLMEELDGPGPAADWAAARLTQTAMPCLESELPRLLAASGRAAQALAAVEARQAAQAWNLELGLERSILLQQLGRSADALQQAQAALAQIAARPASLVSPRLRSLRAQVLSSLSFSETNPISPTP